MGEDIFLGPSPEVQCRAHRHEFKALPGEFGAALALQHLVEAALQFVQIEHVLGCILLLRDRSAHGRPSRNFAAAC